MAPRLDARPAQHPPPSAQPRKVIARGVKFTQAVTPWPFCAPARACLASGFEYHPCCVPSNAFTLLNAAPANQPWHLAVNFTGPHSPVNITARMKKTVRDRSFPQLNRNTQFEASHHLAIRQNYSAMCENIDKRGELDNRLRLTAAPSAPSSPDAQRSSAPISSPPSKNSAWFGTAATNSSTSNPTRSKIQTSVPSNRKSGPT